MSVFNMIGTVKAAHLHLCVFTVLGYVILYGLVLCWQKYKKFKHALCLLLIGLIFLAFILDQTKECREWSEGFNGKI